MIPKVPRSTTSADAVDVQTVRTTTTSSRRLPLRDDADDFSLHKAYHPSSSRNFINQYNRPYQNCDKNKPTHHLSMKVTTSTNRHAHEQKHPEYLSRIYCRNNDSSLSSKSCHSSLIRSQETSSPNRHTRTYQSNLDNRPYQNHDKNTSSHHLAMKVTTSPNCYVQEQQHHERLSKNYYRNNDSCLSSKSCHSSFVRSHETASPNRRVTIVLPSPTFSEHRQQDGFEHNNISRNGKQGPLATNMSRQASYDDDDDDDDEKSMYDDDSSTCSLHSLSLMQKPVVVSARSFSGGSNLSASSHPSIRSVSSISNGSKKTTTTKDPGVPTSSISPSSSTSTTASASTCVLDEWNSQEELIVYDLAMLIDKERRQKKLYPLQRSPELDFLAREHCRTMANNGSVYHSVKTVYELQNKLSSPCVGENIQRGTTVCNIYRSMMTNPIHTINRANVLSAKFTEYGSAIYIGKTDSKMYSCQFFRRVVY
jgi:uncharacterized protein YkwD